MDVLAYGFRMWITNNIGLIVLITIVISTYVDLIVCIKLLLCWFEFKYTRSFLISRILNAIQQLVRQYMSIFAPGCNLRYMYYYNNDCGDYSMLYKKREMYHILSFAKSPRQARTLQHFAYWSEA
jgi:hypothetical protein